MSSVSYVDFDQVNIAGKVFPKQDFKLFMAFIPPLKIINETTEEGPKVLVLEVGVFIMERDWFLLGGSLRIFFFMGGGGEGGGEQGKGWNIV